MAGLELKRIMDNIHHMNSISKPLASLDENSCDDLHTELRKFNIADSRSLPYSNKMHSDDNLVKATIMWKPDVKEEPDEFRFSRNTGITQPSRKSFTTTTLYKKATYGEKENVESDSGWARGSLEFPNSSVNAGYTDGKLLQEGFGIFSNAVTRLEINVVDESNEAASGAALSIGDGKPIVESKVITQKVSDGSSTAILERTSSVYSQKKKPGFRSEDSLWFALDSSIQTRKGAQPHMALVQDKMKQTACLESTETPLLSQFQKRIDKKSSNFTHGPGVSNPCSLSKLKSPLIVTQTSEEHVCDVLCHCAMKAQNTAEYSHSLMRPELLKIPVLSESKFESIQDAQTCEEINSQNNDHFVVLFSEQKTLKRSGGGIIRQELSKLSSLCTKYSLKILSWINIRGCLQRLRQIFSSSSSGFVNLKSQKLPEFSTKVSSLSSNRKLAKDKELKAVLMKINEVLASMERTSPNSTQQRV